MGGGGGSDSIYADINTVVGVHPIPQCDESVLRVSKFELLLFTQD